MAIGALCSMLKNGSLRVSERDHRLVCPCCEVVSCGEAPSPETLDTLHASFDDGGDDRATGATDERDENGGPRDVHPRGPSSRDSPARRSRVSASAWSGASSISVRSSGRYELRVPRVQKIFGGVGLPLGRVRRVELVGSLPAVDNNRDRCRDSSCRRGMVPSPGATNPETLMSQDRSAIHVSTSNPFRRQLD